MKSAAKLLSPFTLIKNSFRIFCDIKNIRYFLISFLPLSLLNLIWVIVAIFYPNIFNGNVTFEGFLVIFMFSLVELVMTVLTTIVGIEVCQSVVNAEHISLKTKFFTAWKKLGGFLILGVIIFLLVLVGGIIFIVPGIILAVCFAFAKFIYVDKKISIKSSLKESRSLVKGRFFAILVRLSTFLIFSILVSLVSSFTPFGAGGVLTSLLGGFFILPNYLLYKEISS